MARACACKVCEKASVQQQGQGGKRQQITSSIFRGSICPVSGTSVDKAASEFPCLEVAGPAAAEEICRPAHHRVQQGPPWMRRGDSDTIQL